MYVIAYTYEHVLGLKNRIKLDTFIFNITIDINYY